MVKAANPPLWSVMFSELISFTLDLSLTLTDPRLKERLNNEHLNTSFLTVSCENSHLEEMYLPLISCMFHQKR